MAANTQIVKVNSERFRREWDKFTKTLAPQMVDLATRKTAFDVGGDIVRSLNGADAGYPTPKRIDTGRYRAGWSIGVREATGAAPGPTTGGDAENPGLSTDGAGGTRHTATRATVWVANNVEYGPLVEYGTETMRPGHHLSHAMLRSATRLREALGAAIPAAWKNQLIRGFGSGPLGGHR